MGSINKTDQEWQDELSPEEYYVTRQKGTEPPFSGEYVDPPQETGVYYCVCCAAPLFQVKDQFESGSGWPSFTKPIKKGVISEQQDHSVMGYERTEVLCSQCDAHLGHVFEDGPDPTGLRFCVNSVALKFKKDTD